MATLVLMWWKDFKGKNKFDCVCSALLDSLSYGATQN